MRYFIINREDYTEELQEITIPDIHTSIGHSTLEKTVVKIESDLIPEDFEGGMTEEEFKTLCATPGSGWAYIGE